MNTPRRLVALALLLAPCTLAAQDTYRQPPAPIPRILDAKQPPIVMLSPGGDWMLLLERPDLRPLSELAAPWLALGGYRLDPATNGPARDYLFRGLSMKRLGPGDAKSVTLPPDARVGDVAFSHDGSRVAFTLTTDAGIEPWILDLATASARRLAEGRLNAGFGAPCAWMGDDDELACLFVPAARAAEPVRSRVPQAPVIEESLGRKAAARTFTNLLKDSHDEALFDHYMTAQLDRVAMDGTRTRLLAPALLASVEPSPDGELVLVQTVARPYSHSLPVSRFPRRVEVIDSTGRAVTTIADLPLADDIPITFDSVRQGPRSVHWRGDRPATLAWTEALDGGDSRAKAAQRDVVREWPAPFEGTPRDLWRTEMRVSGIAWGRDDLALLTEGWWATRRTRTWIVDPSHPEAAPRLLWDRDAQDAYGDPGDPVMELGEHGEVLRLARDGRSIHLSGRGASAAGLHPFLDRLDLRTSASRRLWRSEDPHYESVVDLLDDEARAFVTRRESATEPPNHHLRRRGRATTTALTDFADPAPELAGVTKSLIRYRRDDGVDLSATLYLPAGYDAKRDGPLSTLFWAYPSEFKSRDSAGQVTTSPNRFTRPSGSSVLFVLTQGYAVVDGPAIPILGEGKAEPNDTYVTQLVAGAKAAIDHVVSLGVTDRGRCAIGGHSYGAFTAANLLAHSDLFRAAIARSGAYNRTLTPFGFQGEERSFWEAQDTYVGMSPFAVAASIDEPLLLIHGSEDSNAGTFPIQSERLYEAVKGLGGTVRLVKLPYEDHGYNARESVGHVLWETIDWLDRHVKTAPARITER